MYDRVNVDSTINMIRRSLWISATEASALLGVSRTTLYAYVSRGFVRSQATPGPSRDRRYSRDDVDRLRRRTEERRNPDKAVAHALQWGMPVLESAISFIDGHRLYYRGHDALVLASTRSIEEVASLIWLGRFDAPLDVPAEPGVVCADDDLPFAARAQSMLATASARDPAAMALRGESVAACGWRILRLLCAAASGSRRPGRATRTPPPHTIDQRLARAWRLDARGVEVLRNALILCADHELNVSSFTARCVASAGSDPYAVVSAGLSALTGPKHGGSGARVEAMLQSIRGARHVRAAVAARLRRGERVDGFGHPLYAAGDPRARLLLDMLRERYAKSPELRLVVAFETTASALIREKPNLDFSLAAVARVLGLPDGSPLMVFAIGRTIGWIGHAIEQYARDQLIRPRAKYVGVPPITGSA
jgi:citrate synthase